MEVRKRKAVIQRSHDGEELIWEGVMMEKVVMERSHDREEL